MTKFKKSYETWSKDRGRTYDYFEVIDDIVNGSPYYSSSGQLETLEGEISDLKNLCVSLLRVMMGSGIMSDEDLCKISSKYEVVSET